MLYIPSTDCICFVYSRYCLYWCSVFLYGMLLGNVSVCMCFQVLPVPALEAGTLEKHAPSVGGLLKTLTALCAAGIAVFMAKL